MNANVQGVFQQFAEVLKKRCLFLRKHIGWILNANDLEIHSFILENTVEFWFWFFTIGFFLRCETNMVELWKWRKKKNISGVTFLFANWQQYVWGVGLPGTTQSATDGGCCPHRSDKSAPSTPSFSDTQSKCPDCYTLDMPLSGDMREQVLVISLSCRTKLSTSICPQCHTGHNTAANTEDSGLGWPNGPSDGSGRQLWQLLIPPLGGTDGLQCW